MSEHDHTIERLTVRTVNVTLPEPMATASGRIGTAPLVLLDLHLSKGLTGHAYLFTYSPMALRATGRLLADMEGLVTGEPLRPRDLFDKLDRSLRLLGPQGLAGMCVSAIDMAAWDALARAQGVALARLLGAAPRPVPAYYSASLLSPEAARLHTKKAVRMGFSAFKVKIGHKEVASDMAVIDAIRDTGGEALQIMSDYNQSLAIPEAIRRIGLIEAHHRLAWIEEPVLHHDFAGHAEVRAAVATPIQLGENWWGLADMAKSVAAGAGDFAMPDVMKIGGVTGWLEASSLAKAHGIPVSSHIFPEISAHPMCATPGAHYLEWLDFAGAILARPLEIADGCAIPTEDPGSGVDWDEKAVAKYQV
jgi:mandelate racemase